MHCAWCGRPLGYVHGHAACLHGGCSMFGLNQAECCSGETMEAGGAPPLAAAPHASQRTEWL